MLLLILSLLAAPFSVLVHPVHASLSEVQWNSETKALEVSLRLSPDDARWITKNAKLKLAEGTQRPTELKDVAKAYIAQRLRFRTTADADSNPKESFRWIGDEVSRGYEWWYFEIKLATDQPPESVQCSILLDREKNYVHRMNIRLRGKVNGIDFSNKRRQTDIEW